MRYTRTEVKRLRMEYPPGTQVILLESEHLDGSVPPGTLGTVLCSDKNGTVYVLWHDGFGLGPVYENCLKKCCKAHNFKGQSEADVCVLYAETGLDVSPLVRDTVYQKGNTQHKLRG